MFLIDTVKRTTRLLFLTGFILCCPTSAIAIEVLIEEVADTCQLSDTTFEEMAKVSNRALYLTDSGDYEQAIECYLSLLNAGEPGHLIYKDLSISYSKAGKCEEAQQIANRYVEWAKKDWAAFADHVAAGKGVFNRDWTDFSERVDIQTPYEEVDDPQKESIMIALQERRTRLEQTEHNKPFKLFAALTRTRAAHASLN